ncbi:transposase [Anaerococcus sp. AGMB00486]|uniref:Transposase n=2 Tax=Anaerococcus TaxID=165779 RepID=A0ABX2N832_9FIRM|nr:MULTISPECIES: transposase [Anaerococcus]MDY3005441.1 transposase [Anaerococcus porci]MSS77348.1 transposase [Anaerococcus porci]NVF10850.1 transposase [Anaerococcus faecalis]
MAKYSTEFKVMVVKEYLKNTIGYSQLAKNIKYHKNA